MGVRIKRDKLGRVFISEVSEEELSTTITEFDIEMMEEQAERNEERANQAADLVYGALAYATAKRIGAEVSQDIAYQFQKFGPQRVDGFNWIAIITEEFGETVAAYNKQDYENVLKEANQTIACLMRFVCEVEREMRGSNVMERDRYTRAQ